MKNTYKFLSTTLCLFLFLVAGLRQVNAQVLVITYDAYGNQNKPVAISADFPIYILYSADDVSHLTGADLTAYTKAMDTWKTADPNDYNLITGLNSSNTFFYLAIKNDQYLHMDPTKKSGLQAWIPKRVKILA